MISPTQSAKSSGSARHNCLRDSDIVGQPVVNFFVVHLQVPARASAIPAEALFVASGIALKKKNSRLAIFFAEKFVINRKMAIFVLLNNQNPQR